MNISSSEELQQYQEDVIDLMEQCGCDRQLKVQEIFVFGLTPWTVLGRGQHWCMVCPAASEDVVFACTSIVHSLSLQATYYGVDFVSVFLLSSQSWACCPKLYFAMSILPIVHYNSSTVVKSLLLNMSPYKLSSTLSYLSEVGDFPDCAELAGDEDRLDLCLLRSLLLGVLIQCWIQHPWFSDGSSIRMITIFF